MQNHNDEDRELLASLRALQQPADVPHDFSDRVLAALRERQSERLEGSSSTRNRGASVAWAIAAALVIFVGGIAIGRASVMPASSGVGAEPPSDSKGKASVEPNVAVTPNRARSPERAEVWF